MRACSAARRATVSSSSAWKSCAAIGRRLQSRCSANSISVCSPIKPVDAYLADVVKKVRNGDLDASLVYRKNLRKDADEYTATTPPHVVAARKSTQPLGRLISYVMTTAGAEPLDNIRHPLDREHYVLKQIKPVAEPVLATLGLDFERVIGDRRQLDLYSQFDAD